VTRLWAGQSGAAAGAEIFSLHCWAQTGSGTNSASYPMGNGGKAFRV